MTTETSTAREWVLVPREPTEAMLGHAYAKNWEPCEADVDMDEAVRNMRADYRAMLAAAPPPAASRGADKPQLIALIEKERDAYERSYSIPALAAALTGERNG